MRKWRGGFVCCALVLHGSPAFAQGVKRDSANQSWTLTSGPVTYRLARKGEQILLDYFRPSSKLTGWSSAAASQPRYDLAGLAEGRSLAPDALRLVSQRTHSSAGGRRSCASRSSTRASPCASRRATPRGARRA
jgi:hypothetical protein